MVTLLRLGACPTCTGTRSVPVGRQVAYEGGPVETLWDDCPDCVAEAEECDACRGSGQGRDGTPYGCHACTGDGYRSPVLTYGATR